MSPLDEPKSTLASALILPEGGKRFIFSKYCDLFLDFGKLQDRQRSNMIYYQS